MSVLGNFSISTWLTYTNPMNENFEKKRKNQKSKRKTILILFLLDFEIIISDFHSEEIIFCVVGVK